MAAGRRPAAAGRGDPGLRGPRPGGHGPRLHHRARACTARARAYHQARRDLRSRCCLLASWPRWPRRWTRRPRACRWPTRSAFPAEGLLLRGRGADRLRRQGRQRPAHARRATAGGRLLQEGLLRGRFGTSADRHDAGADGALDAGALPRPRAAGRGRARERALPLVVRAPGAAFTRAGRHGRGCLIRWWASTCASCPTAWSRRTPIRPRIRASCPSPTAAPRARCASAARSSARRTAWTCGSSRAGGRAPSIRATFAAGGWKLAPEVEMRRDRARAAHAWSSSTRRADVRRHARLHPARAAGGRGAVLGAGRAAVPDGAQRHGRVVHGRAQPRAVRPRQRRLRAAGRGPARRLGRHRGRRRARRAAVHLAPEDDDRDGEAERAAARCCASRACATSSPRWTGWRARATRPAARQRHRPPAPRDPTSLRPTGGLAESLYTLANRKGAPLPALTARRAHAGRRRALAARPDAGRAERTASLADAVPAADDVPLLRRGSSGARARRRGPSEDGALTAWDSTRGLHPARRPGLPFGVGPASWSDPSDDIWPRLVRLTLVLDRAQGAASAGSSG